MGRKILVLIALVSSLPTAAGAQEGPANSSSGGALSVPSNPALQGAVSAATPGKSAGGVEQVRSIEAAGPPPGGFLSPASADDAPPAEPARSQPPRSEAPPFDPLGVHAQAPRGPRRSASSVTRPLGTGSGGTGSGGTGSGGMNTGGQGSAAAAAIASMITAGDLIGFSRDLGDSVQAITIINASQRWMAVYHIDSGGQIRLTSSRPLDADFTIQFNASAPLPEEIRRLQGK
jgi:hypothetical protein